MSSEEGEPGAGEEGAGDAVDGLVVRADEDGVAAAQGLDHGGLGQEAEPVVVLSAQDVHALHREVGVAGLVGGEGRGSRP